MKKKTFTLAVIAILSAFAPEASAFPTWPEVRSKIVDYYKRIATYQSCTIDSDGDLEIKYTSSRTGKKRTAYFMMIEPQQSTPGTPPAVVYFETAIPSKASREQMSECADAINWALPGVGHAYYRDKAINVASPIYAFSADYVYWQLPQLQGFSEMAMDLAEPCTDYVTDSFFQYYIAPGFTDFSNRVVKQLNEMGFNSAMEASDEMVEFNFKDLKIRISPQGYSLGDNQFVMVGTQFLASDYGVKPEKAKKIVAEQFLKLSCTASRIVASEEDGTVMIIAMMPTKDQNLEEELKRCLVAYANDVAATAANVKKAFIGKKGAYARAYTSLTGK